MEFTEKTMKKILIIGGIVAGLFAAGLIFHEEILPRINANDEDSQKIETVDSVMVNDTIVEIDTIQ